MSKIKTKEQASCWLERHAPHLELLEWNGRSYKSKFLDKNRGVEFCAPFRKIEKYPLRVFGASKEEKREIRKKVSQRLYGVDNLFESEEIQEKIKRTNIAKYGVEYPAQNKDVYAKVARTNLQRYGVSCSLQSEEAKKKTIDGYLKKYGCAYAKKTPAEYAEISAKIQNTKINKGAIFVIDGMTLKEIAKEKSCGYSTLCQVRRAAGDNAVLEYEKIKKTAIESKVEEFLFTLDVGFSYDKLLGNFRPDFIIDDFKLIIECDGLYWHSEDVLLKNGKAKTYHKDKKAFYEQHGYGSLFFREDEINNKFHIVQSIIKNKLSLNQKLYARKCKIQLLQNPNEFLKQNHLMGKGSGRGYALVHDNEVVAVMQVKWKDFHFWRCLEVSRFCTKNNLSVVGGFSKLLKHVINQEKPNSIITFIDKRYGRGAYLESLGFSPSSNHLSFCWTDYKNTYHRMKFKNNSGFEHGLDRIWDCGQQKYYLHINDPG